MCGGNCGGCNCDNRELSKAEELAMLDAKEKMLDVKLKLVRDMKEAVKAKPETAKVGGK